MFTVIQDELTNLVNIIEDEVRKTNMVRNDEPNHNAYIENTGRLIGLTLALNEIEKSREIINDHIIYILNNTTDGNFSKKMNLLLDENEILRDKVDMLNEDLDKYSKIQTKEKYRKILNDLGKERKKNDKKNNNKDVS